MSAVDVGHGENASLGLIHRHRIGRPEVRDDDRNLARPCRRRQLFLDSLEFRVLERLAAASGHERRQQQTDQRLVGNLHTAFLFRGSLGSDGGGKY